MPSKPKWKRNEQFVIFYDYETDFPIITFDTPKEIIAYRNLEYSKATYDLIMVELYRALNRPNHYTEMLGRPMTVYLIDINETDESEELANG